MIGGREKGGVAFGRKSPLLRPARQTRQIGIEEDLFLARIQLLYWTAAVWLLAAISLFNTTRQSNLGRWTG